MDDDVTQDPSLGCWQLPVTEHLRICSSVVRSMVRLPPWVDRDELRSAALEAQLRAEKRHTERLHTERLHTDDFSISTAYLRTVARGAVLDHLRTMDPATRAQRQAQRNGEAILIPALVSLDQVQIEPSDPEDPTQAIETRELLSYVQAALTSLPTQQQHLVEIVCLGGKPLTYAADELGLSYGQARRRLEAALLKMRTVLYRNGYPVPTAQAPLTSTGKGES